MKKSTLLAILMVFLCLQSIVAQQIANNFFGINHWMPQKYLGPPVITLGGLINFPNVQQLVKDAGSTVYRIGGNGYDTLGTAIGTDTTNNDYILAIQKIKNVNPNAKFLIQVPFKSGTMTQFLANQLVQNIASRFPNDKFYYSVGNEWDKYKNPNTDSSYSSAEIKSILKNYIIQMKLADSTIRIVAPALSYFTAKDSAGHQIMQRLLDTASSDNLTMVINQTGFPQLDGLKYYFDVIDFHSYGGNYGNLSGLNLLNYDATRNGLINYSYTGFTNELSSLQTLLINANTLRPASPLTFAITEMNVCYKNPPATIAMAAIKCTNSAEGLGCRSFFCGQAWADLMSSVLKSGTNPNNAKAEFFMPWSIYEARGKGTSFDLGMTKDSTASATVTPTPLSSYYHYKLMSTHFSGKFNSGISSISPSVKTFASLEPGVGFYIMILNRDTLNYPFNIDFAGNTGNAALNLTYNFIPSPDTSTYNDVIENNSTILLQFNCHGSKIMKIVYSLQDAISDATPHLNTAFATICSPSTSIQENANKTPQMFIYPNPGTGAFSLNFANADKGNYTLSIHDVLGRLINERKIDFNLQKTITFEINSKGFYFVSLQNGNNRYAQKVLVR